MIWPFSTEREKWASRFPTPRGRGQLGLACSRRAQPRSLRDRFARGVLLPRFTATSARQLLDGSFRSHAVRVQARADYRRQVRWAISWPPRRSADGDHRRGAGRQNVNGAGAKPLSLSGLDLGLDPKCDLARTAVLRRNLGHDVYILDPFGQSGEHSACFNALDEIDPRSPDVIDDASAITPRAGGR